MKTIAVTGRTGVGKSRLLATLIDLQHMKLVDPLAAPVRNWVIPEPGTCGGVVIDHAHSLDKEKETIAEIVRWCEQNDVPLVISEISLSHLYELGISLPKDTFELHLLFPNEVDELERSEQRTCLTFDAGVKLAKQLVTRQHG